jgi:hypothetical protein
MKNFVLMLALVVFALSAAPVMASEPVDTFEEMIDKIVSDMGVTLDDIAIVDARETRGNNRTALGTLLENEAVTRLVSYEKKVIHTTLRKLGDPSGLCGLGGMRCDAPTHYLTITLTDLGETLQMRVWVAYSKTGTIDATVTRVVPMTETMRKLLRTAVD